MTLRLTRTERAAFYADKRPNLTRDKQPDCEKGDLYVLSWARPKPYSQPAWCRRCNSQLPPDAQDFQEGESRPAKPKKFCDFCGSTAIQQAQQFRSHREPLYWLRITKVTRRARGDWQIHYELVDRRSPKRWMRPKPPARVVKQDEVGSVWEAEARSAAEHSAYQTTARGALDPSAEAVDAEAQAKFSKEGRERDRELAGEKRREVQRLRDATRSPELRKRLTEEVNTLKRLEEAA